MFKTSISSVLPELAGGLVVTSSSLTGEGEGEDRHSEIEGAKLGILLLRELESWLLVVVCTEKLESPHTKFAASKYSGGVVGA